MSLSISDLKAIEPHLIKSYRCNLEASLCHPEYTIIYNNGIHKSKTTTYIDKDFVIEVENSWNKGLRGYGITRIYVGSAPNLHDIELVWSMTYRTLFKPNPLISHQQIANFLINAMTAPSETDGSQLRGANGYSQGTMVNVSNSSSGPIELTLEYMSHLSLGAKFDCGELLESICAAGKDDYGGALLFWGIHQFRAEFGYCNL